MAAVNLRSGQQPRHAVGVSTPRVLPDPAFAPNQVEASGGAAFDLGAGWSSKGGGPWSNPPAQVVGRGHPILTKRARLVVIALKSVVFTIRRE